MSLKEQVIILKVRYDEDYDQTPNTWNWTELLGSDYEVEVLNYGATESAVD